METKFSLHKFKYSLLLGIILISSCSSSEQESGAFIENDSRRSFASNVASKVEWESDPNQHLLYPTQIEVHDDGVYVVDQGNLAIKTFSLDGELLATIGRGRGQAPGELQTITDFFVKDGQVWILDGVERRISVFTEKGDYLSRFLVESDTPPFRITPAANDLVVKQVGPSELFLKIDTTGQTIERFGDFMAQYQIENPLAFGGDLITSKNRIIFGASHASYIHYFTMDGVMTHTLEMVDELKYGAPSPEDATGGTRMSPPESPIRYRAYTAQKDTLKVNAADYENRRSIIDYYSISGRKYLESVQLPQPATLAFPYKGYIFANRDTSIVKYRVVR